MEQFNQFNAPYIGKAEKDIDLLSSHQGNDPGGKEGVAYRSIYIKRKKRMDASVV